MHRFIPAMASLAAPRLAQIKVRHHPRKFGSSKYGFSRIYKVALDLVIDPHHPVVQPQPDGLAAARWAPRLALLSLLALLLSLTHGTASSGRPASCSPGCACCSGALADVHDLSRRSQSSDLPHGRQPLTGIRRRWRPSRSVPSHERPGLAPAAVTRRSTPLVAVIPVVREPADIADGLGPLPCRPAPASAGRCASCVVLDGPQPRSREALRALRQAGEPIEILCLPHPMGEAAALSVGLAAAGDADVLTLPADPSVEPGELPRAGRRRWTAGHGGARPGEAPQRRQARLASLRHVLGSPFLDVRSPVRAMRAEVAAELQPYGNQHRFLPLIAQAQGFSVSEIVTRAAAPPPTRRRRLLGADWSVLLDVLTIYFLLRFLRKPFRFFGGFGFAVLALGGLATLWLAADRLIWGVPLADRPALILSTLMVVLGLQIISVGLIGEIIAFTYAKDHKDYKVDRLVE